MAFNVCRNISRVSSGFLSQITRRTFSTSFKLTKGLNKISEGKLAIAYTCNVCNVRSSAVFSKLAYNKGVVIVKCPSCSSDHLISDQLGWFGDESRNIEDILKENKDAIKTELDDASVEIITRNILEEHGEKTQAHDFTTNWHINDFNKFNIEK